MASHHQQNGNTNSKPVLPPQGSGRPMDAEDITDGQRPYRLMIASADRLSKVYASRNTYEAQQPGDLVPAIEKLHGANSDISFRCALRHLTFHFEHDRIFESGLLEQLQIDIDNFGTEDEINKAMDAFGQGSALQWAALPIRYAYCNMTLHDTVRDDIERMVDITGAYAGLFECCAIQTVSLPAQLWQDIPEKDFRAWFRGTFPSVVSGLKYWYNIDEEPYILFGSREMIGDRRCDVRDIVASVDEYGQYTIEKERVADDVANDDVSIAGEQAHWSATEPETEPDEDVAYTAEDYFDLAEFVQHVLGAPENPKYNPRDVRHLAFDVYYSSLKGSGLIELFGLEQEFQPSPEKNEHNDDLSMDSEHKAFKTAKDLQAINKVHVSQKPNLPTITRATNQLRELLLEFGAVRGVPIDRWMRYLATILAPVCTMVCSIEIPKQRMEHRDEFLRGFPNVREDFFRLSRHGRLMMLGVKEILPEHYDFGTRTETWLHRGNMLRSMNVNQSFMLRSGVIIT